MKLKKYSASIISFVLAGSLCVPAFANGDTSDAASDYLADSEDAILTSIVSDDSIADSEILSDDIAYLADADEYVVSPETIQIGSAEELRAFRDRVNYSGDDEELLNSSKSAQWATVKLTADIDLGDEEWVPIGTPSDTTSYLSNSFKGTFDGGGYTISNFKITDPSIRFGGLFAVIQNTRKNYTEYGFENDVAISNLKIENASINIAESSGDYNVGIVVGAAYYPSSLENIEITGSSIVMGEAAADSLYKVYCGFAIGFGTANVDDITTEGSINIAPGDTSASSAIGGIIGFDYNTGNSYSRTYADCISNVDITVSSYANLLYVGGISGYTNSDAKITNCSYSAPNGITVTPVGSSQSTYVGGIAGLAKDDISGCNVGKTNLTINGGMKNIIGGVAAWAWQSIMDCTVSANISNIVTDLESGQNFEGGIVGLYCEQDSSDTAPMTHDQKNLENCIYNGSEITANSCDASFIGAISGYTSGEYTVIKNCYAEFDKIDVTAQSSPRKYATYVSGLCGRAYVCAISECFSKGNISVNSNGAVNLYVSGLVGELTDDEVFTSKTDEDGNTSVTSEYVCASLKNSYSSCPIYANGKSIYAGGICGMLRSHYSYLLYGDEQSSIKNCMSSEDVVVAAASTSIVGSGIGYSIDSYISDCYSKGDLYIQQTSASVYAGGFIGRLKENITDYPDVDHPLSETLNCYAQGQVIADDGCTKLVSGAFTSQAANNVNAKVPEAIVIAPKYTDCYYLASEALENNLGTCVTDPTDQSAFVNFDFDDYWVMTSSGPALRLEYPSVIGGQYEYENGQVSKLTGLVVSNPKDAAKIILTINDSITEQTIKTIEIPIGELTEANKYFKTIYVDYTIDALSTIGYAITEPVDLLVYSAAVDNGKFSADIANLYTTSETADIFTALYDSDGRLTDVTMSNAEIAAGTELTVSVDVPENAKVFVWHKNAPIFN